MTETKQRSTQSNKQRGTHRTGDWWAQIVKCAMCAERAQQAHFSNLAAVFNVYFTFCSFFFSYDDCIRTSACILMSEKFN